MEVLLDTHLNCGVPDPQVLHQLGLGLAGVLHDELLELLHKLQGHEEV